MSELDDACALARRFLRPERADLDALKRRLDYRGEDSGAAVWRRAAASGAIPPGWVEGEPARWFRDRGRLVPTPNTAYEALLFASDPRGLVEAEGRARAVVEALAPWMPEPSPAPNEIVWRVAGNPVAQADDGGPPLAWAGTALDAIEADLEIVPIAGVAPHTHVRYRHVERLQAIHRRWRHPRLADPARPWLELLARGYWLWALGWGGRLELAAPQPPPTPDLRKLAAGGGVAQCRAVWSTTTRRLRLACARGDADQVRRELPLLPADDEPGEPRLIHFAVYGGPAVLDALRGAGLLDVEARDRDGKTPLMLAAGLPEVGPAGADPIEVDVPISAVVGAAACRALIAAAADLEARDVRGLTALHWAVVGARLHCVDVLLEAGADVGARDHLGRTPLMLAAGRRAPLALLESLLDAGADADARDHQGWTVLHYVAAMASSLRERELERLLIRHGAVPSRDREGRTPAMLQPPGTGGRPSAGPFARDAAVAAGPGRRPRLDAAALDDPIVRAVLDGLVPAPRDRVDWVDAASERTLEHWQILADWLQGRGDARGEFVALSVARTFAGRRSRALEWTLRDEGERLRARLDAGLFAADPHALVRPSPLRLGRTHGLVTRAHLEIHQPAGARGGPGPHGPGCLALLAHEPLLADLTLRSTLWRGEASLVQSLAAIEPAPQVRRLTLAGLPESIPALAPARTFPNARSLRLHPNAQLSGGRIQWPGLRHLEIRNGVWVRGNTPVRELLRLELPDLTHLDVRGPERRADPLQLERWIDRLLARMPAGLAHLRLARLNGNALDAALTTDAAGRLRTLDLARLGPDCAPILVARADRLAELEAVRLDRFSFYASATILEPLRRRVPRLIIH